jgi:glycosyltransferase involved in cell wall biosynthesis
MSRHVSRSVSEDYGIDPGKVRCVYAGSNVDAIAEPAGGHDHTGRCILFNGRDRERKGGPDLLAAFRLVRQDLPDATLVVAGCRPAVSDDGVTVLGEVTPPEVSAQLHRATVFCMPTRREPFGVVFVEALKHGVPVVAPDIGALPDLVQPGETGELTRPADVRAIADALLGLRTDPDRARRFGTLGRTRMEARYTWPSAVGAMATQIAEVTGMAVAARDGELPIAPSSGTGGA